MIKQPDMDRMKCDNAVYLAHIKLASEGTEHSTESELELSRALIWACTELQQLRAAKAADRERVRIEVSHVAYGEITREYGVGPCSYPLAESIASRVADALAVPGRITHAERDNWRTASGEPQCQGCGESWDTHGRSCAASEGAVPARAELSEEEPRVLETCEALHMIANGSLDVSEEDALRLENWLANKLNRWNDGHHVSNRSIYDHTVKLLALEALTEWRLSPFHPLASSAVSLPPIPPLVRELVQRELDRVPAGEQHDWERTRLQECLETLP